MHFCLSLSQLSKIFMLWADTEKMLSQSAEKPDTKANSYVNPWVVCMEDLNHHLVFVSSNIY